VAYTGQSLKRLEDPRLLTGQGAFLDDLTFPEMLYAAVLRSPHAHASISAIDTAAARHAPGVVAVFTAEDLEGVVEPLPTRRETEAQELRPSTRSWRAARCVTPGSPWPLSSPRSAPWSTMPWP
jgi:CO/xanthine dehydrogenase Mo-binding subunit